MSDYTSLSPGLPHPLGSDDSSMATEDRSNLLKETLATIMCEIQTTEAPNEQSSEIVNSNN
eukprot:1220744-Amphidinium_carterae.3